MSSEQENLRLLPTWMHPWAVDMWSAMEPENRTIQGLLEIRRNERIDNERSRAAAPNEYQKFSHESELAALNENIRALEESLGDEIYNRLEAIAVECHGELMTLITEHRQRAEAQRERELNEAEQRAEWEAAADWPNDPERALEQEAQALKRLRRYYAEHKWDEFAPDDDLYEQVWNILEGKLDEVLRADPDDKHWALIEYLADNFSYWVEESNAKTKATPTTP